MGTMTPPPGQPSPYGRLDTGSASTGRSPWRISVFVLAGVAAALWFRRPAYLPDLAIASANADGTAAGPSEAPIFCKGTNGCLVIYVAPWCGPCRASLSGDVALAEHLRTKGYETVFVVGMDKEPACLDMTRSIGRPTRLDTDGKWAKAAGVRGVPHFLVTTPTGKIVKRQAGAYMASVEQVAKLLGIS
jgi:hypothetical protein